MRDFKEGDTVRWVGSSRFTSHDGTPQVYFDETKADTPIHEHSVGTVYYADGDNYSVFVWGEQKNAPFFDQPSFCNNCPWRLVGEEEE